MSNHTSNHMSNHKYNSTFICTYNYYDPSLNHVKSVDGHVVNLDDCVDLEDCADIVYKSEMLQIFNLQEYNDDVIYNIIIEIYALLKDHTELKECMKKVAEVYLSEDLEIGFFGLFAYNYFFLTHRCIGEFMKSGKISDETIILLQMQTNA